MTPEENKTATDHTEGRSSTIMVDGHPYMRDARGSLVPMELVRAQDQLEDDVVQKVVHFATELSDQIARFKAYTFEDLGDLDALLMQEYGVKKGGAKGNRTYTSFDGLQRVSIRVNDLLDFGPQLQVAKALLDECLNEWAAESRAEIRAIVTRAFNTDKEGQINRSEIFTLLRCESSDPRWNEAMRAIRDAMRIIGSKTYVNIQQRSSQSEAWKAVTIDLAKA